MSELSRQVVRIDAKTFQNALGELTATMVQKVFREGRHHLPGPAYVSEDIATLLRYGASVYNLLNYLNADERRKGDPYWYVRYGVTGMSLVRSLIDCLYNITAILEDPAKKGPDYRRSGIKRTLDDLESARSKYSEPEWEEYIEQRRTLVELLLRASGFTLHEVLGMKKKDMWPTFGVYITTMQSGALTGNQIFLKTFAHLEWRQYSALSHGAYEAFIGTLGDLPVGAYYMSDFLPHEQRDKLDETYHLFLSTHLGRAASLLLCIVTELQAYCHFEGANINDRICKVWRALLPLPTTKELYEGRYFGLMRERGIVGPHNEHLLQG